MKATLALILQLRGARSPNPFIVDAVNKYNDSKVVDYRLMHKLVTGV